VYTIQSLIRLELGLLETINQNSRRSVLGMDVGIQIFATERNIKHQMGRSSKSDRIELGEINLSPTAWIITTINISQDS
jgi:hypothetical protein